MYGDSMADLRFLTKVRKKLVRERDVYYHIILFLNLDGLVMEVQSIKYVKSVIDLFRFQYKCLVISK
jgi:hypothetical protein